MISIEIKHRLLAMQALETARCFEEGVLTDGREADVGSILGFGFAPFSGGTLSYIDMMGVKNFVELCQRLQLFVEPGCLGIETVEQVRAVRAAGCTLGQGFYFSRAVPDYLAAMLLAQELEGVERLTG